MFSLRERSVLVNHLNNVPVRLKEMAEAQEIVIVLVHKENLSSHRATPFWERLYY